MSFIIDKSKEIWWTKFLFTDTDSLIDHIKTRYFYEEF